MVTPNLRHKLETRNLLTGGVAVSGVSNSKLITSWQVVADNLCLKLETHTAGGVALSGVLDPKLITCCLKRQTYNLLLSQTPDSQPVVSNFRLITCQQVVWLSALLLAVKILLQILLQIKSLTHQQVMSLAFEASQTPNS